MKVIFINPGHHDFNVLTPLEQPLGGSQSALCYLCPALAKRGHQVILISSTTKPGTYAGVRCEHLSQVPAVLADERPEAVVILNRPDFLPILRDNSAHRPCVIFWTEHNINHRELAPLANPDVFALCNWFVLVSEWHRTVFINRFRVSCNRTVVLRNAVAPAFERLFPEREEFDAAKRGDPVLVYTSAPFRGLSLLADVYSELAKHDAGVALRIFSSMAMYQRKDRDDHHQLYARCRSLPRTEYSGSIPQPRLAAQLRASHVLAYPNTFAETSCITVMESMGAGCLVVTSDYAALAETSAGYGLLVPVAFRGVQDYANEYFRTLSGAINAWRNDRARLCEHLWQQVEFVNRNYTWDVRAAEWDNWLRAL